MDIQETRRQNLRQWTKKNGVPQKEKSYFSQLLGGASFGERAARRLEQKYGMRDGSLDLLSNETLANEPLTDLDRFFLLASIYKNCDHKTRSEIIDFAIEVAKIDPSGRVFAFDKL